jgi:hypothetical protein
MQGCHSQFLAGKASTVSTTSASATIAAAAFYSAKSRQGLDLGGLASCGSPGMQLDNIFLVSSKRLVGKTEILSLSYNFP